MHRTRQTLVLVGLAALAAALLVGGGVAIAAGSATSDDELSRLAERLRQRDSLSTAVAKQLGTTAAKLDAAIKKAASSRIDAAEQAGTISAEDADTLREAVATADRLAARIARAADVAKTLGVTEAKLDAAYAAARKAEALERVGQALEDGRITKQVADQLRTRIEQTTFPGFGAGGPGRHGGPGHGGGFGPMGGGHRHGGLGPLEDGDGGFYRGEGSSSSGGAWSGPTGGTL